MSKALLPRPIPVGLLVATRPHPEPQRVPRHSTVRWLWPAAATAWLAFLGLASAGLTAVALRPVPQTVTEEAYFPPPPRLAVVEPDPPVLPGEVRPPLPGMPVEPTPEPTPPAPAPTPLDPAAAAPCGRFGTAIDFVRSPSIAFDRATRERKLVLVLHLAGHFEDPGFT